MKTSSITKSVIGLAGLAVGLLCVAALSGWGLMGGRFDRDRVYRIGFGNDIPYHFKSNDGEPSGLAHDLVAAAARHQGIQLEWIEAEKFSKESMDFWVLMTIKPERLASTYFTEPYLQTGTCFLVLENSSIRDIADLSEVRISHANYGVHRENLAGRMPNAPTVPCESSRDAVKALLEGQADTAYLDQYAALQAMLEGQLSTSVRVIDSGFPSIDLALASTFEQSHVADHIRSGMGHLARRGDVQSLINRWALFPNVTDNMVEGLVEAERQIRILVLVLSFTLLALVTSVWLALRLRKQTSRLTRVQSTLRESAEQYRAIVENTNDIVYSVDVAGKIRFLGPQAARYGIDPESAVSKSMIGFIAESDHQKVLQAFKETIETKKETTIEFRIHQADGEEVWMEERGSLIRDDQGEVIGITGALRDISERKQAEVEQKELEERLRHSQKMEAIGLLAGGIAHDFNNILAAMTINLGLMKENPRLDEPLRVGVDELTDACERAAGLTRQLLTFSRRSVLEVKPLDLAEVVAGMCDMIRRLLGESIVVEFNRRNNPLPAIEADAGILEQVLLNLCVNARDAMPNGGRITITTDLFELTSDQLHRYPKAEPGEFVRLSIVDTGCGMDAKILDQIFDPFFTTKDVGQGTGLGLATVQGAIDQHGGWIDVTSQEGHGTTFRIIFPTSEKAIVQDLDGPAVDSVSSGEMVMIVEDDPEVRSIATRALKKLGYGVYEAGSGPEAIQCWRKHGDEVELLLTDVVLPEGMSGLELAEQLLVDRPELPVIVSSGYNSEGNAASSDVASRLTYLPKPYTIGELGKVVRDCLDQRK